MITGASSGIGKIDFRSSVNAWRLVIDEHLHRYGIVSVNRGVIKVVLWDLDLEGLDELKQNIEAMNGGVEVSVDEWPMSIRRSLNDKECTNLTPSTMQV